MGFFPNVCFICEVVSCFFFNAIMSGGRRGSNNAYPRVEFHDLIFPARSSGADYYGRWSANIKSTDFYRVVMCKESAIIWLT